MAVRNQGRHAGKIVWMSCPFCKEKLAGTDEYEKICTFPSGRGLDKHAEICKYNKDVIIKEE